MEGNKEVARDVSHEGQPGVLHTPFSEIHLAQFAKEHPEKREELKVILDEIDRQCIANFAIYDSARNPGVAFSHARLVITPELVQKLAAGSSTSAEAEGEAEEGPDDETGTPTKDERVDWYLFTAFAPPPAGDAFSVLDIAIDRFVRLMPAVARAVRRNEVPPEINLHLLGAPTGFGGKVTQEWIDDVKKRGLEPHAELYAEFIETREAEPTPHEKKRIVLQGASKGAVLAGKVTKHLPEELRERTQRLLDNPAGGHEPGGMSGLAHGIEVGAGLAAETLVRMAGDPVLKSLMKLEPSFRKRVAEVRHMPEEDMGQKMLKLKAAFLGEGLALLKGTSSADLETERSFIRRATKDPLTFSPKFLRDVRAKKKEGVAVPFFQKGRSVEVPFDDTHFFIYDRYHRWAQILEYLSRTKNEKVTDVSSRTEEGR